MHEIFEFVDERQKSWCIHCGKLMRGINISRDHVPSKSLLHKPYPPQLPVVPICKTCNGGFSSDEQYLLGLLGCTQSGSTLPEHQNIPKIGRLLEEKPKLRARLEQSRVEYKTNGGDTKIFWKPEGDRVKRIILKNARGHIFFEYGEPMLSDPDDVLLTPLCSLSDEDRSIFEDAEHSDGFFPEVGSRMMTRLITGLDLSDGWIVVQDGVYRYAVIQSDGLLVKMVLWDYLAAEVHWRS
jgi:hypothetical protein